MQPLSRHAGKETRHPGPGVRLSPMVPSRGVADVEALTLSAVEMPGAATGLIERRPNGFHAIHGGCSCPENVECVIILLIRSGLGRRDPPPEHGPHRTLCSRRKRWRDYGRLRRIRLEPASRDKRLDQVFMDAACIKVHRRECRPWLTTGEEGLNIGRASGGLTPGLHVVTDASGRPIPMCLGAG